MLYQIGLFLIQCSLLLRYIGKGKLSGMIFLIVFFSGISCYLYGLYADTLMLLNLLFYISRDFITISIASFFFYLTYKWKRLYVPAILLLVLSHIGLHYFLPGKYSLRALHLDENAEIFLWVNVKKFDYSQAYKLKSIKKIAMAFQPSNQKITELDEYLTVDIAVNTYAEWKKILKDLRNLNGVKYVEYNQSYSLWLPNNGIDTPIKHTQVSEDPLSVNQWALHKLDLIGLNNWLISKNIKVQKKGLLAILDTGIDKNHEDLAGNYKSIASGSDADPKGHGTHCAGIASAVTGNHKGIASLNISERLFDVTSIRVLNAAGYGTKESIVDGILEATDKGATVISLSLGGPGNPWHQRIYKKAVAYAAAKGAIVVVAAGNSNRNAKEFSPANVKGVITVSAVDEHLSKATFSNKVTQIEMAVAAPGVQILSTLPNNQYGFLSGTSMATPYTAATITLIKVMNPALNTREVFSILEKTGLETNQTKETGKFIQPLKALENISKIK
jgi:thermitase